MGRFEGNWAWEVRVGANQLVNWFFGGKGLGIQQGTSVWVGLPKSEVRGLRYPIDNTFFFLNGIMGAYFGLTLH